MFDLTPGSSLAYTCIYLTTEISVFVNATEVSGKGKLDSPPMFNESPQNLSQPVSWLEKRGNCILVGAADFHSLITAESQQVLTVDMRANRLDLPGIDDGAPVDADKN